MAYTPTTWAEGDLITAQKLNKIEGGIQEAGASGGPLMCTITDNYGDYTLNKTAGEVMAAVNSGAPVMAIYVDGSVYITYILFKAEDDSSVGDGYTFTFMTMVSYSYEELSMFALTANDYPIFGGVG